ncbi:MAG: hypothetical protein P4K92_04720 [Candidatus Nitrosotalea sp.]|nr:hypothetical protein [Candidatus Nitrosotalea sp.]
MILNSNRTEAQIKKLYPNIKRAGSADSYSSDNVVKMSKADLKKYLSDLDMSTLDFA